MPFPGERELRRKLGESAVDIVRTGEAVWGWRIPPDDPLQFSFPALYAFCPQCWLKWEKEMTFCIELYEDEARYKRWFETQFLRAVREQCDHIPADEEHA